MPNPLDPPGSGRPNGHFASNGLPDPSGSSGSSIFSSPQKKMPNALGLPGSGRPNGHFAGNGHLAYQIPAGRAGWAFFQVLRMRNCAFRWYTVLSTRDWRVKRVKHFLKPPECTTPIDVHGLGGGGKDLPVSSAWAQLAHVGLH